VGASFKLPQQFTVCPPPNSKFLFKAEGMFAQKPDFTFNFHEVTMMTSDTMSRLARFFRAWIPAALALMLSVSAATAQSPCEKELAEAEAQYQLGRLEEAIASVNHCLNKGEIGSAERERSYLLLGKTHYAKSLLDSARTYLRKLLEVIPNWRPDPENDSPSFQQLAAEVIREFEMAQQARTQEVKPALPQENKPEPKPSSGGKKKWLWISGGAIAAGTAAFLISRGEEKPVRLPDPPAVPRK
jgi:tetratricopeptide (TPR) repeat protein